MKIAVDFGGVCSAAGEYEERDEDVVEMINVPHCIRQLKGLGHRMMLVSFCGRKRALATRDYLEKKMSGLFDQLFFVKKRASTKKPFALDTESTS